MLIYTINDGSGEPLYYPTLAEAKQEARYMASSADADEVIEVEKCLVAKLGGRETACALLKGHGWCESHTVVFKVNGGSVR